MGCSDLQSTRAKGGVLAAMRCLSLFPGGLLSAGSAFEVTTNLAWKLPQHLPCLLWWEPASKIGTPDSVSSRLVVTYSELFPSQLFLLKTFFNIYGDSRVEILPGDECTHFNALCEVECLPLSLPLSPLLSPHQCLPVGVLTRPVGMSSLYALTACVLITRVTYSGRLLFGACRVHEIKCSTCSEWRGIHGECSGSCALLVQ